MQQSATQKIDRGGVNAGLGGQQEGRNERYGTDAFDYLRQSFRKTHKNLRAKQRLITKESDGNSAHPLSELNLDACLGNQAEEGGIRNYTKRSFRRACDNLFATETQLTVQLTTSNCTGGNACNVMAPQWRKVNRNDDGFGRQGGVQGIFGTDLKRNGNGRGRQGGREEGKETFIAMRHLLRINNCGNARNET